MKLVKKILNKFNGLHYPQEYLCLCRESFEKPLHAYVLIEGLIVEDITNLHCFAGYSPLIFSMLSSETAFLHPEEIQIVFTTKPLQLNEVFIKKDAVALLTMKKIKERSIDDETSILYYEGINGSHHFLSSFHQYIISLNNRLHNKKPGNVFLHDNLYKQVQIAYSVPRIISLITVNDGNLYNLFPTDLHGPVNDQYYVSSLRHEGIACKQVEHAGRIVISEIHCNAFKTVYSLGKNHMQEVKPKNNFPFDNINSSTFQLPLPKSALSYRELELLESFEYGIHKLLLYKIVSQKTLSPDPATLAHIHNVYATWRHNKGLAGNYLLR